VRREAELTEAAALVSLRNVRFRGQTGHEAYRPECPL